ncbi:MAG: hypothetical protein OEY33_03055 [Bdellovibrionales bacterium]|jgi:hypothetical protein|nr:hypothetical protein [Bdellovibrionales bacterium]
MKTDFDTLRALASYTLNHLKEGEMIDFNITKREDLIDAMATEMGASFATDEDIKQQAIEEVEDKMGADNVPEDVTESEIYNHARKEIIKSFNGENIGGLYLVESLHKVGQRMTNFLLDCDLVEDVFGTDEELINFLVQKIRQFTIKRA